MAVTSDPNAKLVAALLLLGLQLEALEERTGVMSAPGFDEWFLQEGGAELLAKRLGRPLGLMAIHLLRRAARLRPDWLDPGAVDLRDPLALQLLELSEQLAS